MRDGLHDRPIDVPCGRCMGCRLEYSRQWAMRCVHEASLYDDNCFVTLTYDDDNLPAGGSLVKRHFQLFMKRLRKEFDGKRIRYFASGEYGDKFGRPHYHGLLFGLDFSDKRHFSRRGNYPVYTSPTLSRLWSHGLTELGSVSYASAAYVARYVVKKFRGSPEEVKAHYGDKEPEFSVSSSRPGIGKPWYEEFKKELLLNDSVIIEGREVKGPKYYDVFLKEEFPKEFARLKGKRKRSVRYEDSSDVRLDVKRQVVESRLNLYERCV